MFQLKYAISQIKDGNMGYRYSTKEQLIEDKTKFLENNGFDINKTVSMDVEMIDEIEFVDEKDIGKGLFDKETAIRKDAIITETPDINLFLNVGDCLPIIIFDNKKGILSLVHHGWPNTDLQLISKVLDIYIDKGSKPEDIKIVIGPGIKKDSLIYDINIFNKITTDWGKHIKKISDTQYSIDNLGYTLQQIESKNIPKENIEISDVDTFKDERYFSHVRDFRNGLTKDTGRFAMVASFSKLS